MFIGFMNELLSDSALTMFSISECKLGGDLKIFSCFPLSVDQVS